MKTIKKLLSEIDKTLLKIKSQRPLSKGELAELKKTLKVEFTYNSNSIEGNTLTLGETKLILEDGLTVGGKSIREINETLNHNKIFDFLYLWLQENKPLDEKTVFKIHQFVLKNIDDENAGKYRKIQVRISGEEESLPLPSEIKPEMDKLFHWFESQKSVLHPVDLAANFHYRFVKIHPFVDGNGRTVRVLMNLILMRFGYPMIIIPTVRRMEYIQTLNSRSSKEKFTEFFCDIVLQNLKDYLRMIDPEIK